MKELILVRHAKSDWGSEVLKDIDRPLNERGYRDAYFMSNWFVKEKAKPQVIISSSATRALSTAMIFARTMDADVKKIRITEQIYEAHYSDLIKFLTTIEDTVDSLMVFCHNPSVTEVCNELSDDVFIENVPTCGIVNLRFDVKSWKELGNKKGKLGFFQYPKDFRNTD
ncbi:MAG TPA: histidine phosphatase family protein [Bacteroidia bacterium]|nr:histidine phosphatase family protein [Bacteroidia bacterium]